MNRTMTITFYTHAVDSNLQEGKTGNMYIVGKLSRWKKENRLNKIINK